MNPGALGLDGQSAGLDLLEGHLLVVGSIARHELGGLRLDDERARPGHECGTHECEEHGSVSRHDSPLINAALLAQRPWQPVRQPQSNEGGHGVGGTLSAPYFAQRLGTALFNSGQPAAPERCSGVGRPRRSSCRDGADGVAECKRVRQGCVSESQPSANAGEGAALGLIWVFAGVAGDRKRSRLINGPSVEIGSDRFRALFRRAC